MRIALVTEFYSKGMGYIENTLTKTLAAKGHDVHVVASDLNAYGNSPDYKSDYEGFLGPAQVPCGVFDVDGYTVHRLPHRLIGGYVCIQGLVKKVAALRPDVIQIGEAAGPAAFVLAAARRITRGRFFTACHQTMSVTKQYLRDGARFSLKRAVYWTTRTLPGWLTAQVTEKCYAATPDCAEVAHRFYGVPWAKIVFSPLGCDTALFRPAQGLDDLTARRRKREMLGCRDEDVVCIYTGRFSAAKNPLLLARAISGLRQTGEPYRGVFVGDGPQGGQIEICDGCVVVDFVKHRDLIAFYQAADVGVWPFQESLSMIDAAACGLPLLVSDRMGAPERIEGNGLVYREGSVEDLIAVLRRLGCAELRRSLGDAGAVKVHENFGWDRIAERRLRDYEESVARIDGKGAK